MAPRRSFWAWSLESEEPSDADRATFSEHGVDFTFDTPQGSWIPGLI